MSQTAFRLPSGAVVEVQSSVPVPGAGGPTQASGATAKARETWDEGLDLVREVAQGVIEKLKAATASADEVTVEFGLNISGKTGVILVEGSVAANLKLTVKWKTG